MKNVIMLLYDINFIVYHWVFSTSPMLTQAENLLANTQLSPKLEKRFQSRYSRGAANLANTWPI